MRRLRSLRQYGTLPRLLGWSFLVVGFVSRLPTSMVIIGVLTLVAAATGSVGAAGAASASLALATAASGPLIGRWTDKAGQRLPLLVLAPINAAALVALVAAARAQAPLPALCLLCVLVGATTVPVGSLARVRWLARSTGPRQTGAALSYESMADELVFVLGPALVGVAASAASPALPVLLAALLVAAFVPAFALHPTAARDSRVSGGHGRVRGPRLATVLRAVAAPVAGMACVGMFFGASQTAVTAYAADVGEPSRAGLVYALMGTGSAVAAIAVIALPEAVGTRLRLLLSGAGMAALAAALTAAATLGSVALLVLAVGFFVGPAMVTLFTVAGRLAPTGATAAAMTALGSANVVGVAAAAALAGALSDAYGPAAGFTVAAAAGAALAVLALALRVPARHPRAAGPAPAS
ncbi:MFS transporter [Georgenia sp. AZ-5]|uniref:MFS transporter n=1 Tax=Georgenia sp. AZ-5 TaxID=3367526 RepID=UPI0037547B24